MRLAAASGLLWLLLGAELIQAQAASVLRGRVVSDAGVPVAGATITLTSIGYSVRTDSLGVFQLSGTPGSTMSLTIRADGFRDDTATVTLSRGRPVERDFALTSESDPLPEVNPSDRALRGRVTDPEGAPIAYANVQLNAGSRYISDDSGRFTIPVNVSGRLTLLLRRIGFEPEQFTLAAMPDTAVRITLKALPTALPEQRVTGRSPFASLDIGGFYRRMADVERGGNRGYFVTPEELELRKPFLVTSAVEHIPGIRIRGIPTTESTVGLNRDMRIEDTKRCPLTVYLDRVRVSPVLRGQQMIDERINALLVPSSLSGIEVYPRHLGAPPDFSMVDGTCGLVILWTR